MWERKKKGKETYSDDGLADSLPDGVDLGDLSSTLDLKSDVHVGELVGSDDEDGLVVLVSEESRLGERDGLTVKSDETSAGDGVGDGSGGLMEGEKQGNQRKDKANSG